MIRGYSLLRHVGQSVLFGAYKDSLPMAVFTAYFDASGDKQKRVLAVAGFVATVTQWTRFDEDWKAILDGEGVTAMHMTDFASSQREFASWKNESERRKQFVDRLSRCIKRRTNKGFASSVVLSDYEAKNGEFRLRETVGQPFTLVMMSCLGGLKKWAYRKKVSPGRVLVYIEQGDQDQRELIKRAASRDGFTVIALPKDKSRAFQAGDMVAWKSRTAVQDATDRPLESIEDFRSIVRSLALIKHIVQDNGVFDEEALRNLCTNENVPLRNG
jgi:hypothetical protein